VTPDSFTELPTTLLGLIGLPFRLRAIGAGQIQRLDGSPMLRWSIGAGDRWVAEAASTRSMSVDGLPVHESRVRTPGGDVVVRSYLVADAGGALVLEVDNEATFPVAFAIDRNDAVCAAAMSTAPADAGLGERGVAIPVLHGSTARLGVPLTDRATTSWATSAQVLAGWKAQLGDGERWEVPGDGVIERQARSLVVLGGDTSDDLHALLLATERDRRSRVSDDGLLDVVGRAERIARRRVRSPLDTLALTETAMLLERHHDERAARDAWTLVERGQGEVHSVPSSAPDVITGAGEAAQWLAASRTSLVAASRAAGVLDIDLFAGVVPDDFGQSMAVFDVGVGQATVSAALRWHGDRPALLWDVQGAASVRLRSSRLDPSWSTQLVRGEALLGVPSGGIVVAEPRTHPVELTDDPISFS
jgi:hypothetical protein